MRDGPSTTLALSAVPSYPEIHALVRSFVLHMGIAEDPNVTAIAVLSADIDAYRAELPVGAQDQLDSAVRDGAQVLLTLTTAVHED